MISQEDRVGQVVNLQADCQSALPLTKDGMCGTQRVANPLQVDNLPHINAYRLKGYSSTQWKPRLTSKNLLWSTRRNCM